LISTSTTIRIAISVAGIDGSLGGITILVGILVGWFTVGRSWFRWLRATIILWWPAGFGISRILARIFLISISEFSRITNGSQTICTPAFISSFATDS
jgi:hypothetical protein